MRSPGRSPDPRGSTSDSVKGSAKKKQKFTVKSPPSKIETFPRKRKPLKSEVAATRRSNSNHSSPSSIDPRIRSSSNDVSPHQDISKKRPLTSECILKARNGKKDQTFHCARRGRPPKGSGSPNLTKQQKSENGVSKKSIQKNRATRGFKKNDDIEGKLAMEERIARSIERVICALQAKDLPFQKPKTRVAKPPLTPTEPPGKKKRGRPKGSKNRIKLDSAGNKIPKKSTFQPEKDLGKTSVLVPKIEPKIDNSIMPIKKRNYNQFLINSLKEEVTESAIDKKVQLKSRVAVKTVAKNLRGSQNCISKFSGPLKKRLKNCVQKGEESDEEFDVKNEVEVEKAKPTKRGRRPGKGKENFKVSMEKVTKSKNVSKCFNSDCMGRSDLDAGSAKPPKKALKDKWSREVRLKKYGKKIKEEVSEKPKAGHSSKKKRGRSTYYDNDSERESDDSDKRFQIPKRKKKKRKETPVVVAPKRTARMASLNAIAMMACMNEDAKVPLTSSPTNREQSMALVLKKDASVARTHSTDEESDSDRYSPRSKASKRKSESTSTTTKFKRKKRRGELDVQMDIRDMVVTKRMASLNASAIMAASYSVESRSRRARQSEFTNVDIEQISYKATKSQSTKSRSVITVQETTKKVKKAQGSRQTEVEEHIIVKKRVKRQRGLHVNDDDDDNGTDNSELENEILPKSPDDPGLIVESTITFVSTQTHTVPQAVSLSGVSKYCISSNDGRTTTVVQQVQKKSTTSSAIAPQSATTSIPTALIPPNQHVPVPLMENRSQHNLRMPMQNYSPLGALEVMQPTIPHSHHSAPNFLIYPPQPHHLHGSLGHHHLHPPPQHIQPRYSSYQPPLSPHSPPYPPPSSSSPPLSPSSNFIPPPPAHSGYRFQPPSANLSDPGNSQSPKGGNLQTPRAENSLKQGNSTSVSGLSQGKDERMGPPTSGPSVLSERHHSAFTAPTPSTHSPASASTHGYLPVSGPMPTAGAQSAKQASPRLTSPPPNKHPVNYSHPTSDHFPSQPYHAYSYPSPYDKYYHPRPAYHFYQSPPPYSGGPYPGSPQEYGYQPPPPGTVHYSQESYTSYTLCVPAPAAHGSSQLPSHPQTLALPPPPPHASNVPPHTNHPSPYPTYQYTEFAPFPYPPAGPPPNAACCPPPNVTSGSLPGSGKPQKEECRGKSNLSTPISCNNYQYYPHLSEPNHQHALHPLLHQQPYLHHVSEPHHYHQTNLSTFNNIKPSEKISDNQNNTTKMSSYGPERNVQNLSTFNDQTKMFPSNTSVSLNATNTTVAASWSSPLQNGIVSHPSNSTSTTTTCSSTTAMERGVSPHYYITTSACGKTNTAVPNNDSTFQISTWVVPSSASQVVSSSSPYYINGITPSHTLPFSPTTTTTSISLSHQGASTNPVMATTGPVVTSLERFPSLNQSKSASPIGCSSSSEGTDSDAFSKEKKTETNGEKLNKDLTAKKATISHRTGARHLLCQSLPLTHSKTGSVLAKAKPSSLNKVSSSTSERLDNHKVDSSASFSSSKPVKVLKNAVANENESKTLEDSSRDHKPLPKKRGRPPKAKDTLADGEEGPGSSSVTLEKKPFFQAPGEVTASEDNVPRKRMSLLKSSGAKNSLAIPNAGLKKLKSSSALQDPPLYRKDMEALKAINVKTEVQLKIKAEKVSPKNMVRDSSQVNLTNGDVNLGFQGKEVKRKEVPSTDTEHTNHFPRLKNEELVSLDSDKRIKRRSNDNDKQGNKTISDKNGKFSKLAGRTGSGRSSKPSSKLCSNSKVRRKASLLAYLKEKNNESDTSIGESEDIASSVAKNENPPPFLTYSPSSIASRGRRTSGTGKGKQMRKQKPIHGWSWEGEPHEGKIWLTNDEEQMMQKCYSVMKHKEGDLIKVRDCVLLKSGSKRSDLPYVAKVAALWEDPETGDMMMSILWYYRPEHTETGRRDEDLADEIFASKHRDHLSVACIEDRCYVLTYNEYCRYRRLLQLFQEKLYPTTSPVPTTQDLYFRKERQPPGCVVQDILFFCRKVYDYRQKRILKNPC